MHVHVVLQYRQWSCRTHVTCHFVSQLTFLWPPMVTGRPLRQCHQQIYIAHNRKASNAPFTLVEREEKSILYFTPVVSIFFFLSFSQLILSSPTLEVYHTFHTHGVASLQIQNACLKCAARSSLKIQDAKNRPKICHMGTIAQIAGLYLRNKGMYRQSEKNC